MLYLKKITQIAKKNCVVIDKFEKKGKILFLGKYNIYNTLPFLSKINNLHHKKYYFCTGNLGQLLKITERKHSHFQ